MKKQRKLNNKGFSMVELVIVIAIMAVLVSVLAPQYIKYVEQSRVSTDDTNANEILKVVQILVADGTIKETCTVTWANPDAEAADKTLGTITVDNDDSNGTIKKAIEAALSNDIPTIQSKTRTAENPANTGYVISVDFDDEAVFVSVNNVWNS